MISLKTKGIVLSIVGVVLFPFSVEARRIKVKSYFNSTPQKSLRIVFDLDNTLVGTTVHPEAGNILKELKERGHTLILWTTAGRGHWDGLRRMHPEIDIFDEVYTYEDMPLGHTIESFNAMKAELKAIEDCPDWVIEHLHRNRNRDAMSYPPWLKDIRFVEGDIIFDDATDEIFSRIDAKEIAGLRDRYIQIWVISNTSFDPDWINKIVNNVESLGG